MKFSEINVELCWLGEKQGGLNGRLV